MTRVLIAELKHEANTFSPISTTLDSFRDYHLLTGAEVLGLRGTRTEVGGFLDVAQEEGWDVVPVVAAMAMSGGKVTAETYAALKAQLLGGLGRFKKHLPEPQSILSGVRRYVPDAVEGCARQEDGYTVTKTHPSTAPRELLRGSAQDASAQNGEVFSDEYSVAGEAVLLALHGAMVVDGLDDPEGDILAAVRAAVGPHVPIAASLDLHGNITPAILAAGRHPGRLRHLSAHRSVRDRRAHSPPAGPAAAGRNPTGGRPGAGSPHRATRHDEHLGRAAGRDRGRSQGDGTADPACSLPPSSACSPGWTCPTWRARSS